MTTSTNKVWVCTGVAQSFFSHLPSLDGFEFSLVEFYLVWLSVTQSSHNQFGLVVFGLVWLIFSQYSKFASRIGKYKKKHDDMQSFCETKNVEYCVDRAPAVGGNCQCAGSLVSLLDSLCPSLPSRLRWPPSHHTSPGEVTAKCNLENCNGSTIIKYI